MGFSAPGDIIINIPENGTSAKKKHEKGKKKEMRRGKEEKGNKKQKEAGGLFGKKKDEWPGTSPNVPAATSQPVYEPVCNAVQAYTPTMDSADETQCISTELSGVRLRLIGNASLPPVIDIRLKIGENYTIGRYDAAIGKQQSNFEFDKKTKAISRRHAVIERHADGYSIIDLSSSAGTFLSGQKMSPNTPFELSNGCSISFGNAGADYIWESSDSRD